MSCHRNEAHGRFDEPRRCYYPRHHTTPERGHSFRTSPPSRVKVNPVSATTLISANVLFPLTDKGLVDNLAVMVGVDFWF
jgi:hypothetical protein